MFGFLICYKAISNTIQGIAVFFIQKKTNSQLLRVQCTKTRPPSCNAYIALKQNRNHSNLYIVGISNEQGIHNNDDRRYVINERGVTRQKPQF